MSPLEKAQKSYPHLTACVKVMEDDNGSLMSGWPDLRTPKELAALEAKAAKLSEDEKDLLGAGEESEGVNFIKKGGLQDLSKFMNDVFDGPHPKEKDWWEMEESDTQIEESHRVEKKQATKAKPAATKENNVTKTKTKPAAAKAKAPEKPKTQSHVKVKTQVHTKTVKKAEVAHASKRDRKLKLGDISACREGSNAALIASAFGKGRTIAEAIEALQMTFTPGRSKAYSENPGKFIAGYIPSCLKRGNLIEA